MRPTLVITCLLAATLTAQQPYAPARLAGGGRPSLPALAVGGGQVFVELAIGPSGAVAKVTPLRSTPSFTEAVIGAVRGWQFVPATADSIGADGKPEGPKAVAATVLVAGQFRAPTLMTPTLGERPVNVGTASAETAYPSSTSEPPFPPQARSSGVVLIEVRVDESGKVTDAAVIGSAPPFDAPALEAVRQWRFRPARIRGRATATYAYVLFGFPEPITSR